MPRRDPSPTIHLIATTTLLVFLALIVIASGAQAQTYEAGTLVKKGDADWLPWPSAQNGKIALCFVDDSGAGAYAADAPLYLDVLGNDCANGVAPKTIRLTAGAETQAGTEVKAGDWDQFMPLAGPLPHQVRFFDAPGKGSFDSGATLYVQIQSLIASRVSVGDLRLTAFEDLPAMTQVGSGDADVGLPLSDLRDGPKSLHDDHMVYKAGDGFYVNVGAREINVHKFGVSDKDVRLNNRARAPAVPAPAASTDAPSMADLVDPVLIGRPELAGLRIAVDPASPVAGTAFVVTIDVANVGPATGSGLIQSKLGSKVVDVRGTPTLLPGEEVRMVFTLIAPSSAGTPQLTVLDLEWMLDVKAPASEAMQAQSATTATSPAPVALAVALIVLAGAALARRRSGVA